MIQSRSNPLVKLARSLRERKTRDEAGLFLVEGISHVGQAVEAGWDIEAILYNPESLKSKFAQDLLSRFPGRQEVVSATVMESLASKDNPAGILAIARQRWRAPSDLDAVNRGVAAVAPQDPGNVGAIMRTMDATACDVLFMIDGGVDPFHPTAVRAAMGACFWKPVVQSSFDELVQWARHRGIQLVGTSAHAERSYLDWRATEPWILVLGSEQKGLTSGQSEACDLMLSLPMAGRVSSLNLAVAAGVLLYHFTATPSASP